ncbi:MAG: glucosaminidase domain-containing protein [Odoribacter sp.]
MKPFLSLLILSSLLLTTLHSTAESRKEFIHKYKQIAIREMERTGIPASITLAQGILESGCGESELAINANNHFGIKCHDWEGATYQMDDDAKDECFRKYNNVEQSWIDHSTFLTTRPRYAGLFDLPSTDYKAWAKGLKAAGYATNPEYAEMLIKIIEDEKLHQYDHPVKINRHNINDEEIVEKTPHTIYRNREEMRNGIICIETIPGDSFEQIASYYGIKLKKLLAYNDKKDTTLTAGQIIFLKKKKTKAARGYEFHRVKEGDTLYDIAQTYGVRMTNLLKYNYMDTNSSLTEGEKIYLRNQASLF